MRRTRRTRLLAALLTMGLLLGGCAAGGGNDAPQPDDAIESGQLYVVDSAQADQLQPVSSEYPSALDENALRSVSSSSGYRQNLFDNATNAVSTGTNVSGQRLQLTGEVKAVWISYLELENLLKGKTEAQFTANIRQVFDNCRDYGLNTVVVHVRPFGDAIYSSSYYPWSYLATGAEGVNPGFDPLEIMVAEAHSRNLRIEAWLNPYRVRSANNANALSASNQAQKWLDAGDSAVIRYNGVISYNPASAKARELIVNGAKEIVENYAVDGIHIDDYFYPSTDAAFDASSYSAYKNGGGAMSLADWRRSNVEQLMKDMYDGIKSVDQTVVFGIAPQSSVSNNYNDQYLDVEKIAGTDGYCDYICPQIYFGFQNDIQPYQTTLETWNRMVSGSSVQLQVGVAVYKVGGVDSWAGSGSREWVNNTDLLSRMIATARQQGNYAGFVLYRYDSLFNPESERAVHVSRESENLKQIL